MGATEQDTRELLLRNLRLDELVVVADVEATTPLERVLVQALRRALVVDEGDGYGCPCCGGCESDPDERADDMALRVRAFIKRELQLPMDCPAGLIKRLEDALDG